MPRPSVISMHCFLHLASAVVIGRYFTSDVMLMENVGFPVAVNPDARLRARAKERGWAVQDWGVSEVKKTKKKPMFNFEKTAARQ